jgi:cytochrome P450
VPITVLISILGLPQEDGPMLIELTSEMAAATDPDYRPGPGQVPHGRRPEAASRSGTPAAYYVFEYGRKIGEERRRNPTDDLVSRLVHAEVDGERLDEKEYSNFFELFIFAGNETTRPGSRRASSPSCSTRRSSPASRPTPRSSHRAVDEILRYGTPIIYFRRTATRDAEISGVPIRPETAWPSGTCRELRRGRVRRPAPVRRRTRPNPHVTFGRGGPHFCLGSFLAHLEIRILLRRSSPEGALRADGEPVRLSSNFINGFKSLPVRVVPAR